MKRQLVDRTKTIIELFPGTNGRWYFHKKFPNGKIAAPSQGYKEKRYAKEAIKRDFPNLQIVERCL